MSRTSANATRKRAGSLLIGLLCATLPWTESVAGQAAPAEPDALRIQGSNTIGAALAPALVKGLFEAQGMRDIRIENGDGANEQRVLATDSAGRPVVAEIGAHGSSTGFTALLAGQSDLAASSRPIRDEEIANLAALGDMRGPDAEQVIAIDGLAVILHPDNPLQSLSLAQLAQVSPRALPT